MERFKTQMFIIIGGQGVATKNQKTKKPVPNLMGIFSGFFRFIFRFFRYF